MSRQNNKIIYYYTITLVVLLVIVTVLLFAFYTKRSSLSSQSKVYDKLSPKEQQAEQVLFKSMEEKAKNLLVRKHKWDINDFSVNERYIDGQHYLGLIMTNNPEIKTGLILIAKEQEKWELLFDPTTANPCALLTGKREYMAQIIDTCKQQ